MAEKIRVLLFRLSLLLQVLAIWLAAFHRFIVRTTPIEWLTAAIVVPATGCAILLTAAAIAHFWKFIAVGLFLAYLAMAVYSGVFRWRKLGA